MLQSSPANIVKPRLASTNVTVLAILGSLALLGSLFALLQSSSNTDSVNSSSFNEPIVLYCAASNKSVIEVIRKDYERDTGRAVQVQYGPSQTLLASAEIAKSGDLYLPADDSYLAIAQDRQLLAEQIDLPACKHDCGCQGNPLKIKSFDDLLRPEIRVAQANPEAAAIGKLTRDHLVKQEKWESLKAKTSVFKMTVNDVLNDVNIQAVDAGIVFVAVLHDYPQLEAVQIPELQELRAKIAVGVLKSSKEPTRALHFARYLSARDEGWFAIGSTVFSPLREMFGATRPKSFCMLARCCSQRSNKRSRILRDAKECECCGFTMAAEYWLRK